MLCSAANTETGFRRRTIGNTGSGLAVCVGGWVGGGGGGKGGGGGGNLRHRGEGRN